MAARDGRGEGGSSLDSDLILHAYLVQTGSGFMKGILSIAITFLISSTSAFAWDATVDGPDVFGKTKVVALDGALNNSLVVQCDSETDLFIAFIFKKKEFQEITEIAAKLFIKTTEASPTILEATYRNWNDNYAGVVASGKTDDIIRLVNSIGLAKGKIEVGYDVAGIRESASFSSRRSTQTIKTVVEKCKLQLPTE